MRRVFRRVLRCAAWSWLAPAAQLTAQGVAAPVADSTYARAHYVKRVMLAPMRDGARLMTIAYVPRGASPTRRYPIVLQRTPFSVGPYDSTTMAPTFAPDAFMLRDGYIFVAQEVRGRYRSEGTFESMQPLRAPQGRAAVDEATDAYDTIAWLLTHLDGNDGRVGLYGVSYGGFYAAAAALSRHPAIVATALEAPLLDAWREDFHHQGVLTQAVLHGFPVFGTPRSAPTKENWWVPAFARVAVHTLTSDDYASQLALGPLREVGARLLPDDAWWRATVAHPNYDAFWRARTLVPQLAGVTHPVLVVGGWYDSENLYGTLAAYGALRQRGNVTLAMGPFGHRGWLARDIAHTVHGDLYFGDSLETALQRDVQAAFFRAQLKGGPALAAGARMFDTGRKQWVTFDRWPTRAVVQRNVWLGVARTLAFADARGRAAASRSFVEFASDPGTPVPSRCGGPTAEDGSPFLYMSGDQRCLEGRSDVAAFQTGVLAGDLTVAGPVVAHLTVSTTGTDADIVVKLVDVYPGDEPNHPFRRDSTVHLAGYQQLVRAGVLRARWRRSTAVPTPMVPGQPAEVTIELPDVFHTFRAGHRVMVQVQGSWFPLLDRNPQRFVPNIYEATAADFMPARHRVWVGGSAGSRLEFLTLK